MMLHLRAEKGQHLLPPLAGQAVPSDQPHLHYEVIKNGKKTNPLSVRLPAGDALKDNELKIFLNRLTSIDGRIQKALAD